MEKKKLSTIGQELKAALAPAGENPMAYLAAQISAGKRAGTGSELTGTPKRSLEADPTKGKRGRQSSKKK